MATRSFSFIHPCLPATSSRTRRAGSPVNDAISTLISSSSCRTTLSSSARCAALVSSQPDQPVRDLLSRPAVMAPFHPGPADLALSVGSHVASLALALTLSSIYV
jgi:hypothetical protein